jgi:hypothetical protein
LRGPWADNDVDAVVLWDALPRQEDADRLYDALGAQIMRHVVEGVGDIARKALEVNDG